MKFDSKFNYNDIIYCVVKVFDEAGQPYIVKEKVVDFIMLAYNGVNLGIRYTHNLIFEEDCFKTLKEAYEECKRRNKKCNLEEKII